MAHHYLKLLFGIKKTALRKFVNLFSCVSMLCPWFIFYLFSMYKNEFETKKYGRR